MTPRGVLLVSPTLLAVEVAAAVARALDDPARGQHFAEAVRALPGQMWLSLDDALAAEAARLAAEYRLRGADAVYAATARQAGTALVTWDRQQLERLHSALTVYTPRQALRTLR